MINRPILTRVTGNIVQVQISVSPASKRGEYSIESYKGATCDQPPPPNIQSPSPQGRPEALFKTPQWVILDAGNGTSNASKTVTFGFSNPGLAAGDKIMAITTRAVRDADGDYDFQSSSEVSNCVSFAP